MTRRSRRAVLTLLAVAAFLVAPAPALAHPDDHLADAVLVLEPGERWSQPSKIHFHRLVGTITASAPVTVRVLAADGPVAYETLVAPAAAINQLVACCSGAVWAEYTVEIENAGRAPVAVAAELAFVHDDLAVVALGEEGPVVTLALIVAAGFAVARGVSRRPPGTRTRRRVARALIAGATISTVALSVVGRSRYGGDAVGGLVDSTAPLIRFSTGPFLSGLALVLGIILVLWWTGAILWSRSIGPGRADRVWVLTGLTLAVSAGASGWLVTQAYGASTVTALLTLAATTAPLDALWIGWRSSRTAADGLPREPDHATPG